MIFLMKDGNSIVKVESLVFDDVGYYLYKSVNQRYLKLDEEKKTEFVDVFQKHYHYFFSNDLSEKDIFENIETILDDSNGDLYTSRYVRLVRLKANNKEHGCYLNSNVKEILSYVFEQVRSAGFVDMFALRLNFKEYEKRAKMLS